MKIHLLHILALVAALTVGAMAQSIVVASAGGTVTVPTVHVCTIPAGHAAIAYFTGTVLPKLDAQGAPTGTAFAEMDIYPNADGSWTARIIYK